MTSSICILTGISFSFVIAGLILIGKTGGRHGGILIYLGFAITAIIGVALLK